MTLGRKPRLFTFLILAALVPICLLRPLGAPAAGLVAGPYLGT